MESKLKKASYIELHELEDNKYRSWEVIGIYKIIDKESWFSTSDNEKITLTDKGYKDLNTMGLSTSINKSSIVFDFLTQSEIDHKIKEAEKMMEFYRNKLSKLKTLKNENL